MVEAAYHKIMRKQFNELRVGDLLALALLCEHGKRDKVAEKLYITSQGLGKQLQGLEKNMGVPLFEKRGKRYEPTDAGRVVLKYAARQMEDMAKMADELEQLMDDHTGYVQFVCSGVVPGTVIAKYIAEFKTAYPKVTLDIMTANDQETHKLVREGYLALTVAPLVTDGFHITTLMENPYRLVVNSAHPLAGLKSATYFDIQDQPLIVTEKTHMIYQNVIAGFAAHNLIPVIGQTVNGPVAAINLIRDNKGCAVMMNHVVDMMNLAGLSVAPFQPQETWDIVFMSQADYVYTPSEELFANYIRAQCRQKDALTATASDSELYDDASPFALPTRGNSPLSGS